MVNKALIYYWNRSWYRPGVRNQRIVCLVPGLSPTSRTENYKTPSSKKGSSYCKHNISDTAVPQFTQHWPWPVYQAFSNLPQQVSLKLHKPTSAISWRDAKSLVNSNYLSIRRVWHWATSVLKEILSVQEQDKRYLRVDVWSTAPE